jgi:hypothetical protein
MAEINVPFPVDKEQHCYISLSDNRISFDFEPKLADGPHKPSRTEIMVAAALVGIARVLTGKGAEQVIHALAQFERETGRAKR